MCELKGSDIIRVFREHENSDFILEDSGNASLDVVAAVFALAYYDSTAARGILLHPTIDQMITIFCGLLEYAAHNEFSRKAFVGALKWKPNGFDDYYFWLEHIRPHISKNLEKSIVANFAKLS
jgi:hypothetical protein